MGVGKVYPHAHWHWHTVVIGFVCIAKRVKHAGFGLVCLSMRSKLPAPPRPRVCCAKQNMCGMNLAPGVCIAARNKQIQAAIESPCLFCLADFFLVWALALLLMRRLQTSRVCFFLYRTVVATDS